MPLDTLALTADWVDLAAGILVFEGLKTRRTRLFRSVPVLCSIPSTGCTALANGMAGAAKAVTCGCGRGRG